MTAFIAIFGAAQAAANSAKTTACYSLVRGYEHDKASETAQRNYSECIVRILPNQLLPNETLLIKLSIVLVLFSMVLAAVLTIRSGEFDSRTVAATLGALAGAVAAAILLVVVGVLFVSVAFLFS